MLPISVTIPAEVRNPGGTYELLSLSLSLSLYIYIYIYIQYFKYRKKLHVSGHHRHLHHLQTVLTFYLLQLQNSLRLQTQYNQYIKMFTYLIVTVDDKIQSTKRCQLSAVVITVHRSC